MNRKSSGSTETQIDNWIMYIKSVHARTQIVDAKPAAASPAEDAGETDQKTPDQLAAE